MSSQDISSGDLLKSATPNDNSPRVSRNRSAILSNSLNPTSKERSIGGVAVDPEKQLIKENMAQIEQNCLAARVFTHVA